MIVLYLIDLDDAHWKGTSECSVAAPHLGGPHIQSLNLNIMKSPLDTVALTYRKMSDCAMNVAREEEEGTKKYISTSCGHGG